MKDEMWSHPPLHPTVLSLEVVIAQCSLDRFRHWGAARRLEREEPICTVHVGFVQAASCTFVLCPALAFVLICILLYRICCI